MDLSIYRSICLTIYRSIHPICLPLILPLSSIKPSEGFELQGLWSRGSAFAVQGLGLKGLDGRSVFCGSPSFPSLGDSRGCDPSAARLGVRKPLIWPKAWVYGLGF